MNTAPQKEHQWLQKLVGEWTYEGEATMGPGKPPELGNDGKWHGFMTTTYRRKK